MKAAVAKAAVAFAFAACSSFGVAGSVAAQSANLAGHGYDKGDPAARITIVEFGDFGCSACARFVRETFPQLNREFIATGLVQWKFVPFVLGSFPNSTAATRAAECAGEQSAFWSMHDLLYNNQRDWTRLTRPRDHFTRYVEKLGLDKKKFDACYDKDTPAARIAENNQFASDLFIRATPTFFINGQRAVGALPITEWRRLIALVASR